MKIILDITPQTWFKVLPGHSIYFIIPEVCNKGADGTCCDKYIEDGNCGHILQKHGLSIKRRIGKYNKYKQDVLHLAKKAGFTLPEFGWALYFYYPVPVRWSKKKKEAMHGQHKLSKPDLDNLEKAFYDSLSIKDETVGQLSGHGKFWDKNAKSGYIEIILNKAPYNPFGVHFIDQAAYNRQPKRKWTRKNNNEDKNKGAVAHRRDETIR